MREPQSTPVNWRFGALLGRSARSTAALPAKPSPPDDDSYLRGDLRVDRVGDGPRDRVDGRHAVDRDQFPLARVEIDEGRRILVVDGEAIAQGLRIVIGAGVALR